MKIHSKKNTGVHHNGFTLIELMIVVAIIAILAAIAVPKFGEMILRSKESTAKGALGTFRSAVDIYYVGNEGKYPSDLNALLSGKMIDFFPKVTLPPVETQGHPGHAENSNVEYYNAGSLFGATNEGTNIWAYVNTGDDMGHLGFNCIHRDTKGSQWSEN